MFCVRLAETVVEIDNRHDHVFAQCRDYLCQGEAPSFRVAVSTQEAQTYMENSGRPMTLPEAESHLLYRRICEQMPLWGSYLLHASVVELNGRGYAFSAERGVGKSTHTALWESAFQDPSDKRYQAVVINGDKPLLRPAADGRFWAYGTPWCGKEGKQVNRKCPLTAICFLERGGQNRIVPSQLPDTAARLLAATILPPHREGQERMASLVGATVREVPAFTLTCTPDREAFEVAYEFLLRV